MRVNIAKMQPTLIKAGRVIDPGQGMDSIADVLLEGGHVKAVASRIDPPEGCAVIEAGGLIVAPGFIDLHCHLREPGYEDKETIATGTRAAARGGFTTVCAMPNTNPAVDSAAVVEFVLRKARQEGAVRVLPIGCITKGSRGRELAQMGELAEAGVVGFSDDGNPLADANLMRQALSYSAAFGLPIINHCEQPELFEGGSMSEGWVANRLGLPGIPNAAEEIMVARDLKLTELTRGRYHVAHLSTAASLGLVLDAKGRGLQVSCEVTPHHLTLGDDAVLSLGGPDGAQGPFGPLTPAAYDTRAKVNPPLRGRDDVEAMIEGLASGTIDFVATDHAPHNAVDKMCTFEDAAFGISVLETAFGSLMSLVHAGSLPLPLLIEKLTLAPARFLDRADLGTLRVGSAADIVILDPNADWVVDAAQFASKGKNTPLDGHTLKGKVTATIYAGEVVHDTRQEG